MHCFLCLSSGHPYYYCKKVCGNCLGTHHLQEDCLHPCLNCSIKGKQKNYMHATQDCPEPCRICENPSHSNIRCIRRSNVSFYRFSWNNYERNKQRAIHAPKPQGGKLFNPKPGKVPDRCSRSPRTLSPVKRDPRTPFPTRRVGRTLSPDTCVPCPSSPTGQQTTTSPPSINFGRHESDTSSLYDMCERSPL